MIWFVVWLAFALFIVWLFARSLRTVLKQQKAWGQFARKHNLLYSKPAWHKPPSLDGEIQGHRLRIYVEEYVDPVRRLREFRTTIELYFRNGFPTGIALGSRAYHELLRNIDNVEAVTLPSEVEFAGVMALSRDPATFNAYMTPRLGVLKSFFGIQKSERLLMGHETDGFMVLQSAESLEDVKDLNARIKMLFALIEVLEPIQVATPTEIEPAPAVEETAEQTNETQTVEIVEDVKE